MKKYNVAVVGATGAVGQEMVRTLERRNFPVRSLFLLASSRSAGRTLKFKDHDIRVNELTKTLNITPDTLHVVLMSAGASISKEYAPLFAQKGSFVIDNSSAWRMEQDIPLVVPEVNPQVLGRNTRIIANPNCSTIQMVQVLKPLHDVAKIKRVVVSTYQSVSGWGREAMEQVYWESQEMLKQLDPENIIASSQDIKPVEDTGGRVLSHQIGFNVIPHIDKFLPTGYTKEEMKMVHETRKILGEDSLGVSATCVRVPVLRGHAESVNVEFAKKISPEKAREILSRAKGVILEDDPEKEMYPLPLKASGREETFVGRIRRDDTVEHGLNLWIVSDNLLKGAALNAVQIAEELIQKKIL